MVSRFPSNNPLTTNGAFLYTLLTGVCALISALRAAFGGCTPNRLAAARYAESTAWTSECPGCFASRCSVQGDAHLAAHFRLSQRALQRKQNSGICIMQTPEFSGYIISQYAAPASTIISEHFAIALSAQLRYNMIHTYTQAG